jgi:putative flippase GtrA
MRPVMRLWARFGAAVAELAKFGTVGAVAAVVDILGSNLLRFGLGMGPLSSKTISVALAATLAFLGNRYWTWRHRARTSLAREYVVYFALNAVGLLIALLVVGFTYYVLRLHGPLAYNVSANIVGLGLGTLFRFWSYQKWVFLPPEMPAVDTHTGLPRPEPPGREPLEWKPPEQPPEREAREPTQGHHGVMPP